ncbi:hypothetical protein RI367_001797 [Sorochytrium milnesiophthora]
MAASYQGSRSLTLLPASGSTPLAAWKAAAGQKNGDASHLVKRVYEKELKGYCCVIGSQNLRLLYSSDVSTTTSTNSNATSTGAPARKQGAIVHPHIVLQLFVPTSTVTFTIEVGAVDTLTTTGAHNRRRYQLSTAIKESKSTPLHTTVPINHLIKRDVWMNVLIDLRTLTADHYRFCEFRSFDTLSLQGNGVRVRQVFTVRYLARDEQDVSGLNVKELASLDAAAINSILEQPDTEEDFIPRPLNYSRSVFWSWVIVPDHSRSGQSLFALHHPAGGSRQGLKKTDSLFSIHSTTSQASTSTVNRHGNTAKLSLPNIPLAPHITAVGTAAAAEQKRRDRNSRRDATERSQSAPQAHKGPVRTSKQPEPAGPVSKIPQPSKFGDSRPASIESDADTRFNADLLANVDTLTTQRQLSAKRDATRRSVLQRINSASSSKETGRQDSEPAPSLDVVDVLQPSQQPTAEGDEFDHEVRTIMSHAPPVAATTYEGEYEVAEDPDEEDDDDDDDDGAYDDDAPDQSHYAAGVHKVTSPAAEPGVDLQSRHASADSDDDNDDESAVAAFSALSLAGDASKGSPERKQVVDGESDKDDDDDDSIELEFDEATGCYKDPKTGRFYEMLA